MTCVLCGRDIIRQMSLKKLLFGDMTTSIACCESCKDKFTPIETRQRGQCQYCYGESKTKVCTDCQYWQAQGMVLEPHIALFEYDDTMSDFMSQYKFQGNQSLAAVFSEDIKNRLSELSYDVVIPMPLSKKRYSDRGFNQVALLLDEAKIDYQLILKKPKHHKKQSAKSRHDRLKTSMSFNISKKDTHSVDGKVIVLVDDVYTTGNTMMQAKRYLMDKKAKKVITFSLAR